MSVSGGGAARVSVSVIVPALDAEATIGRTLAALAAQEVDFAFEVIVADGGSTDRTRAIVEAAGEGVRLLDNALGDPASGRNLAAGAARGEVIAFTDADCEPDPGWLVAGLRALDSADLVQGRVLPVGPMGPFDRSVVVNDEYGLYETANLFVRRVWLERVGGFEAVPGLVLGPREHFGEDTWFAWRCRRLGARSAFAADAVVRHAVFRRGPAGFVDERLRCRYFPPLVAAVPELRAGFLHRRWFLSSRSLRFDLAVAGVTGALFTRRAWPAAAILPYARGVRAHGSGPGSLVATVAADAVSCAALLWGSLRARTAVL